MLVSIAIPVYEMYGTGAVFLELNLKKILEQNYKNVEVVISDHSMDNKIEDLCKSFSNDLKIVYLRNNNGLGSSSANLNNALKHCNGELIKIMMQDEYFYDKNGIEKIVLIFKKNPNIDWLLTGCVWGNSSNIISGKMLPSFNKGMVNSQNTVGSPSVLTIRNKDLMLFNENLLWVLDCDYYLRLFKKYGMPHCLNEHIVYITIHENQVSSKISEVEKKKEEQLLYELYKNEI